MLEDREKQIHARKTLGEAIYQFLDSKGVDGRRLFEKGSSVGVHLNFDDYSRREIPEEVKNFAAGQYLGRSTGIEKIVITYKEIYQKRRFGTDRTGVNGVILINMAHLYPHNPEVVAREKRRVVLAKDDTTGLEVTESISRLEAKTGFNYFILPEKEVVLHDAICCMPFEDPMGFGITYYPLSVWVGAFQNSYSEETAEGRLLRQVDVLHRAVDPHNIGIAEDRQFHITFGHSQVSNGSLEPAVVVAIASLIPDLPPAKQTRQDSFGCPQLISQPSKYILIE